MDIKTKIGLYIIGGLLISSIVFALLFFNEKKIAEGSLNKTNVIALTNYIEKEKPKYIFTNITNTNMVFITNNGKVDSNLVVIMKIDEYSNLIFVIGEYSNYVIRDIIAVISNNILIVSHYKVTNYIKLPNMCNNKNNIVSIGYSLRGGIFLDYGYTFLNTREWDFGVGAFGDIYLKETNADIGVKIIYRW